jgi:hypothetical protein
MGSWVRSHHTETLLRAWCFEALCRARIQLRPCWTPQCYLYHMRQKETKMMEIIIKSRWNLTEPNRWTRDGRHWGPERRECDAMAAAPAQAWHTTLNEARWMQNQTRKAGALKRAYKARIERMFSANTKTHLREICHFNGHPGVFAVHKRYAETVMRERSSIKHDSQI